MHLPGADLVWSKDKHLDTTPPDYRSMTKLVTPGLQGRTPRTA